MDSSADMFNRPLDALPYYDKDLDAPDQQRKSCTDSLWYSILTLSRPPFYRSETQHQLVDRSRIAWVVTENSHRST